MEENPINTKTRVGVIRGGVTPEYYMSLAAGSYVLNNLSKEKYQGVDILITKDGTWHKQGVPMEPRDLKKHVDIVFNTLYGTYGEDGKLQDFLEEIEIPYVGSDPFSSSMTANKKKKKERLNDIGIKTPKYFILQGLLKMEDEKEQIEFLRKKAMDIFRKIHPPWVVKPILGSASTFTYLVTTFTDLIYLLNDLADKFDEIIVEEFVEGTEVVSGIMNGLRGEEEYVLPPFEILKPGKILDYDTRFNRKHSLKLLDKKLEEHKDAIADIMKTLHKEFNLNDYSTANLVISPKGGIYVIEVDSQPILGDGEILPSMMEEVGCPDHVWIDHLIERRIKRDE
ncbi:MAG: ATP-grasp domain-containing protein [Candidatus Paceibacterota bacterium]